MQGADAVAGSAADDVGVTEVGVDAVQTQDTASLLEEGARGAVGADAAREDHGVRVGGPVGVEPRPAVDDDAGEVGGRRKVRVGVRESGRETERGVGRDEGQRAVTEDGEGVGDRGDLDGSVGSIRADRGAADVGIGARGGRVEDDGAVGVGGRAPADEDRGVAGDGVDVSQRGAAAAEADVRLAVDQVGGISAGVSEVLIRAEEESRGVGPAEVDGFGRVGRAQGDGAEGAEADLVDDGRLDAGEAGDERAELAELDRGRGTEVGQRVETVAAGTDVERAGPAGVVGREIDRAVAAAAARGEVEVAEQLGADGGQVAEGADAGVAHQVERPLEIGAVAETDRAVVVAVGFLPAPADDVPVAGRERDVVRRHELAAVIAVDVDVAVDPRTEGRGDRGEVGADADAADVGVARVSVVRLENDVVLAEGDADQATESDVGRTGGALPEHGVDGQGVVIGEDHQFAPRSGHDRPLPRRRAERSRGGARAEQDTTRTDGEGLIGADDEVGRGGRVHAQRVDRLRVPGRRVRGRKIDVGGRARGGGRRDGIRVGRRREPAARVLDGPIGDGREAVRGQSGVSGTVGVGENRSVGAGGRPDSVRRRKRVGRIADEESGAAAAGDRAEGQQGGVRAAAGDHDVRRARTEGGRREGLGRGGGGGDEAETAAAVAEIGELRGVELGADLRGRDAAHDEDRRGRDKVGGDRAGGRRGGAARGEGMGEVERQRADLAGTAGRHAGRPGDDGGRARVSLRGAVDIEGARTDLGQTAGAGEHRGGLAAESGVLAAVADPEGDGVAEVVDQRDVDGGGLLGTGVETADGERTRGDAAVEAEARGVHHVREAEQAVGERVGMLEQDRAVDDGRVAREGIGAREGEHAVTHLREAAGAAFAGAAGGGAITDRAGELDVVAVGVDQDGAQEGDAARDGPGAGSDVRGRAGRPAERAAERDEPARARAVTGGDARRQHLEGAAGVEDETALEGIVTGEGDRGADDVDARLIPARDVRGISEHAATAAEAEGAGHAGGEDARISDVAHAGAEAHAGEAERAAPEVDVGRGRGGGDGHDAGAARIGETIDLGDRIGGVGDDRARLAHDEIATCLMTIDGRRVQGAARGDGDGTVVDGHRGREGVDAAEGKRAQAGLDDPAGGVRGIERADGDDGALAAAAREGDRRDGARLVGARARDDDARDLAVGDDRVA